MYNDLLIPHHGDFTQLNLIAKSYNIKILRDIYGVPHIFGRTDADAAYGFAYAHSADR